MNPRISLILAWTGPGGSSRLERFQCGKISKYALFQRRLVLHHFLDLVILRKAAGAAEDFEPLVPFSDFFHFGQVLLFPLQHFLAITGPIFLGQSSDPIASTFPL